MEKGYITASECITAFKEIGLNVTKGAFSKQKEKGIYKVYKMQNSKRDYFIWDEVLKGYLGSTIPSDHKEDQLRAEIKKKQKVKNVIKEQINIIWGYKDLSFEMFDISNLYDEAQNNLKIMENEISEGKDICPKSKEMILEEALRTKEDHIREFKKDIYARNQTLLDNRDFSDVLCKELGELYSEFRGSNFEYRILKSFAEWMSLSDPKEFADFHGVEISSIKKE